MLKSCQHNHLTLKVQETWSPNLAISDYEHQTEAELFYVLINQETVHFKTAP